MTFTAADYTFTSSPSGIAVADTTIQLGTTAVFSGVTISYGLSGLTIGTFIISVLMFPSSTDGFISSANAEPIHVFTLGGQTLTANPTAVYIDETTLTAGGSADAIFGTLISLRSSDLVIASFIYFSTSDSLSASSLVIDSETFTIQPTALKWAARR